MELVCFANDAGGVLPCLFPLVVEPCLKSGNVGTIREIILYETETGRSEVLQFLETLRRDERVKVMKVFEVVQTMQIVPTNFLKKLNGPDKLWEIRVRSFRFLGFYPNPSQLVLTNAFLKQSQATPDREIAVARQRKGMYLSVARLTK